MKSKELISKHQTCIEVLESVKHFEDRIKHKERSINGFSGNFIWLRVKYQYDIDTYQKCIGRLMERYNNILNG